MFYFADINECIEYSINCGSDKMCFNTLGEFTCIDVPCPRDYHRDPITKYGHINTSCFI